jgi:NAD(P)-dependent dehydrogenase (short-subunit alcohol dehydrogenase family)
MNVLITGGASGLGYSITEVLSKSKKVDNIYITYNNSLENAKRLEKNTKVIALKCDFSKPEDIFNLVNQIKNLDIDVLINNAFSNIVKKHFHKIEPDVFKNNFQVNILPTLLITQEVITQFRKKKFGKIITVLTSYLFNKPPIGLSEYVASKSFLLSMHKSWATENSNFGITSNAISPSFMLTNLNINEDQRILENLEKELPLKKFLEPKEVAETVLFLIVSSQQINGQNLIINQGINLS